MTSKSSRQAGQTHRQQRMRQNHFLSREFSKVSDASKQGRALQPAGGSAVRQPPSGLGFTVRAGQIATTNAEMCGTEVGPLGCQNVRKQTPYAVQPNMSVMIGANHNPLLYLNLLGVQHSQHLPNETGRQAEATSDMPCRSTTLHL